MTYKAMKIKVETPEKSEAVQKRMFELGYIWAGDDDRRVQLTSSKALFTDSAGKITQMPLADDFFNEHRYEEFTLLDGELVPVTSVATVTYKPIDTPPMVPLGLKPRATHDKMRMLEIMEAIHRYVKADKKVPVEWIHEFDDMRAKFIY